MDFGSVGSQSQSLPWDRKSSISLTGDPLLCREIKILHFPGTSWQSIGLDSVVSLQGLGLDPGRELISCKPCGTAKKKSFTSLKTEDSLGVTRETPREH